MSAALSPHLDGRRLRWERHNAERRQHVIDAAVDLLEERDPGAELHVQEIAERAGMNRSVIYRHFNDRSDLDLAVQQEVCVRIAEVLLPAFDLDGSTIREIVHRIIAAYVGWAVAHPTLVRFVEQDLPGVSPKPLDVALEQIAHQIEVVIEALVDALGVELSADDRALLEPWVFGLIGGCFQSLRRWTSRDRLSPSVDYFVHQTSHVVWFQVDGLARLRGIELPDQPVEALLASLDQTSDPSEETTTA